MENEKFQLGNQLYSENKTDEALNAYLDALFQMEPTAELFMKIAHCNKILGETENALEYYYKSLEMDGQNLECLFNAGETCFILNQQEEGIELMSRIPNLAGGSQIAEIAEKRIAVAKSILSQRKGGALMKEGRLDEALEAFQESMNLNPLDERNYSNIGVIWINKGDLEQGLDWFKKAVEVNPEYIRGFYNLGTLLNKTGKYRQAIDYLEKALKIAPEGRDSEDIQNNIELAKGSFEESKREVISILNGESFLEQTTLAGLLNAICHETPDNFDTLALENGHFKIITYSKEGKAEIFSSDEGDLIITAVS